MTRQRHLALGVLLLTCLSIAACGGDSGSESSSTSTAGAAAATSTTGTAGPEGDDGHSQYPVTVQADNGEVTIEARPQAVVSLSPSATEMLFAIGAGEVVVAVDEYSYYPSEAPVTDLSGYEPNVEAIAAYEPDLVIVAYSPDDVVESLEALGATVVMLDAPSDLEGLYDQIAVLGTATGYVREADDLLVAMHQEIEEIVSGLPEHADGRTYFHELDDSLYTVTSSTFIGQVYGLLGLRSIADAADDGSTGGYPQLTPEYIIEADPDFIFLTDAECCAQSAETVAARPGWSALSAVTGERVFTLDADIASRWGPRIVDFIRSVASAIASLEPAQ